MNTAPPSTPPTLGLFEKRIGGDDCLMELARLRFRQAGMGTEIHAATPEQLEWDMQFRPSDDSPVVVHLARNLNLVNDESRRAIEAFARQGAGRVRGLVIHDHWNMASCPQDFLAAAREMNSRLEQIADCPWLFIEYACGLELETFVHFFESIQALEHLSVCVDIGHAGIHATRKAYTKIHPGTDICALKSQPDQLPPLMADIENAVTAALPAVLGLVEELGSLGKPAHFHLHDGHPLSTASPFGVSDHLSFLAAVPLAFECRGRRRAELMFGPAGLRKIIRHVMEGFGSECVSFTLEIHPTMDRLPLGDASGLFAHWRDKTNAEMMNHWLSLLDENHRRLREAILATLAAGALSNKDQAMMVKG